MYLLFPRANEFTPMNLHIAINQIQFSTNNIILTYINL